MNLQSALEYLCIYQGLPLCFSSQCALEALRTFQCKLVPLGELTGLSSEL